MSAAATVRIDRVSKSFGGTTALNNVSFDIRPAEIVGLLGENGAGKSTLIKILAGLHAADSGSIRAGGRDLGSALTPRAAHAAGFSFIHQHPALFGPLSVADNIGLAIDYPMTGLRIDDRKLHAQTEAVLRRMSLDVSPDTLVETLPPAVRSALAIAIAMASESPTVFLDEPTATLTAAEAEQMFGLIRGIRDAGGSAVLVTHRLDEVLELCDRVVVLRDGCVVADEPVGVLTKRQLIELIVGAEVAPTSPQPTDSTTARFRATELVVDDQRPITFDVRPGEVVALTGAVGAGHAELAEALFGQRRVESGSMTLDGQDYRPNSVREAISSGIAYVPGDRDGAGTFAGLSAAENLIPHPTRTGPSPGSGRERAAVARAFAEFDVRPALPESEISAFSGGNAQKIVLARWLSTQPKLAILNEPTAGIDVGARATIYKLVQKLAADGASFLLVSSDFEEVAALAVRAVVCRRSGEHVQLDGPLSTASVTAAALA